MNDDAFTIWKAGTDAVRADQLVSQCIEVTANSLALGDQSFDRKHLGRITVVGGGKATAAMAEGLEIGLGEEICTQHRLSGWINVPQLTERELQFIHCHPARPPGVNEPTPLAAQGTQRILELVSQMGRSDLCILLLSGGGSALLPAPRNGISLDDKLNVTRALSGAGANIEQLNTVRKHLSAIKGGRLLKACKAGALVGLVISDVLGDPLDTIASGPAVADSTTAADALEVLNKFDPQRGIPDHVYQLLRSDASQVHPAVDTETAAHHLVIGNNAVAVDAAGMRAESMGYSHAMTSATSSEGEAEGVGQHLAEMALTMLRKPGPDCLISGGEPVVKLVSPELRGKGGRNQQLILAAMGWLIEHGELSQSERERLSILSGGTDGEDGPTDAAGAILNRAVWENFSRSELNWKDYLRRNDAYHFFDQIGGLIRTGPTHTNVCDLRVITARR